MTARPLVFLLLLSGAGWLVGCGGSAAADIPADPTAEPELNTKTLAAGDFPMVERAGDHLSPFGCRHYQMLHVGMGRSGPEATLQSKLDSADPSDMDPDGSCGGEEIPRGSSSTYPLKLVSRTGCGASVYEGTIKWTESGKVTRTMRLTDSRGAACPTAPAKLVAEVTSTYQGRTNPIATYYNAAK